MGVSAARSRPLSRGPFAACLLAILLCLALVAARGPAAPEGAGGHGWGRWDALAFQGAVGVASLAWLAALALAARGRGDARLALAGALALRLVALGGQAWLSDDPYRYAWEAELVRTGHSPYARAPSDPALAPLRAALPDLAARVNHPDVPAAYPPLAQWTHGAVVAAARAVGADDGTRAVLALRAFHALCDLLVLAPLVALLRRAGRPTALAIAWGWCPLVVLSFAGTGHLDALGILCLVGGLALATRAGRARELAGVALLAAGTLVKLLPALALPFLARGPGAARRVVAFLACVAVGLASVLLFEEGARGLASGLGAYARRWEGGGLVFRVVDRAVRSGASFGRDPREVSRVAVALAWLAVALLAWVRRLDALRGSAWLLGAFLLLTPMLHPWYLAWIAPFVALRPSAAWAWVLAAGPLLWWPVPLWRAAGEWREPGWIAPLVVLPWAGLAALEAWRRRASARGAA